MDNPEISPSIIARSKQQPFSIDLVNGEFKSDPSGVANSFNALFSPCFSFLLRIKRPGLCHFSLFGFSSMHTTSFFTKQPQMSGISASSQPHTLDLLRCRTRSHYNSFIQRTASLWDSLSCICLPPSYNIDCFQRNINSYLELP